ncbi:hypothetical protein ACQ858_01365 [Variovorax ureilyticus]|uniref:hypothetical protein n=1 Tax=Variovorax ureilyticus TaxID=1836198 RepID=UPI003D66DEA7
MNLAVTVNGAAAAADSAGQYAVKPGDTVEVTPSISADWSTTSSGSNDVTLRAAGASGSKWSAQMVNNTTAQATYTVTAKATSAASVSKDAVFKVAGGNAQNGTYRVWATNGTQLQLALNFDTKTYDMTDPAGVVSSDVFSADPGEAGTYVFKSAKVTTAFNGARFRVTSDAVVGAYPFDDPQGTSAQLVQPFVASRAVLTTQADLDGVYTRLGMNYAPGLRDSQIRVVQLSAGGTVLQQCNDVAIHDIPSCTPANVATYTVTPGTNNGWNYVNVANPADKAALTVAYVGGNGCCCRPDRIRPERSGSSGSALSRQGPSRTRRGAARPTAAGERWASLAAASRGPSPRRTVRRTTRPWGSTSPVFRRACRARARCRTPTS